MGITFCCLNVRDLTTENYNGSDSGDSSCLHFRTMFNKYTEIFHRSDQVHVIPSTPEHPTSLVTPEFAAEVSNATSSSRQIHPNHDIQHGFKSSELRALFLESEFYNEFPYSEEGVEEDECPTCLEEYHPENPKIVTKCLHHFHLSCIYDWMERSHQCPVCFRVMVFDELALPQDQGNAK